MARLLLVSNRLPVTVREDSSGTVVLDRSSGGLVSALGPIHDAGDGLWIGNPGGDLDAGASKALADARYLPVNVSPEETDGYYYGYSNSSIWPIFHYLPERAHFDRSQFDLPQIVVPVVMFVPDANSEASTRRRDVSFQAQA